MLINKTIIMDDVLIGVVYEEDTSEWKYYYNHNLKSCKHVNKYWYALYDLFYNN